MRKLLAIILLLIGYTCLAQCPFTVTLQNKGSVCLGKDTLVVNSANKLASIKWYKDGVVDTVVNAVKTVIAYNTNGTTVAGGNGFGTAANQIEPLSAFVDSSGKVYVADFAAYRIQQFPKGSTSATNGLTFAGGNGNGNKANQLSGPTSVYGDGNGNIYVADQFNYRVQKFPAGSSSATNGITAAGGNGYGTAGNQFGEPYGVYIDASGNLYAADYLDNRIQKFPSGSNSSTFGTTVAGNNGKGNAANQFNYSNSVSLDSKGNIYVGDEANFRVQKFPSGSTSLTNGVTVAGGNGQGAAANQFGLYHTAFADPDGNIYVADEYNNRIQKFPAGSTSATNGTTVAGGKGAGAASNQLSSPVSVFIDTNGDMYVSDLGNLRIQKFSAITASTIDSTRILTTPGTYYAVITDTTGCSITTNSITINAPVTPTISIGTIGGTSACSASNTISFKATTTNSGTSPTFQWQVNGVNAGTNDSTFTSNFANNDVVTCTLTSNMPCATAPTVVSNKDTLKIGTPPVANIYLKGGLCLGGDTLVVSSPGAIASIAWYNGNVLDTVVKGVVTTNRNGVTVAGGNGFGTAANQLYDPHLIYVDGGGNIYVADYWNNRIQKFPPGSSSATNGVTVAGGNGPGFAANQLWYPSSVFIDANGYLYVSDQRNNRVQQFPPGSTSAINGTTVAGGIVGGPAANQLSFPTSVFVDVSGNIYVSELGNNRVQKFPAGSTSTTNGTTVAGSYPGGGIAANELSQPTSVFVDATGNIYVVDFGNNRIQKFPPSSTSTTNGVTIAGGNGMGPAANQLYWPNSVFIDDNQNMYVADAGNNRIQRFPSNSTSATNGVTVAGGLNFPESAWVDAKGNIYISDTYNFRILKFPPYQSIIIDTTFIPTTPGTYTAIITDTLGCTVTTNAITIAPTVPPIVNISADKTSVCAGNALLFTATPTNIIAPASYKWQLNGNTVGTNSASYGSSVLANGDAVTCIVTNGSGCIGTDTSNTIVANIKPSPTVGPAADISITLGQSAVLNIPVSGNIASYLWSPPTYLSNNTNINPLATPLKTTTYTLKVVSVDSCVASGYITVLVSSNIYLASAFTPNGDGRNDVFYVLGGLAGDKIKDFSVYARWGQRLFQVQNVLPNDPSFGWNGKYNGALQEQGSYVYVVTIASANGTETAYKGTVMLVR